MYTPTQIGKVQYTDSTKPSHYAYQSIEEIGAAKEEGQVIFQQVMKPLIST